ncbi:proto-oncogene Mas-like [Emydura macquarii macquarii]|uniref:proto-oncogene Mas-like n=1 Tax=Emydura macquarii macquarii TaxID=1129001 RepID=UPI00352B611C
MAWNSQIPVCVRERERPASSSRGFMMTELSTTSLPLTEHSLENGTKYNGTDFKIDNLISVITDAVTLLFCLLGLVGNGIVFWFLSFHIKRNPFTVYILNLAVADFGCLLCMAVFNIIYVNSFFSFSLDLFYSGMSFNMLLLFTYSTSLYLLTAISAERCLSVLFPIWHRCCRPKHLSAILSALLWALSCLLTGLGSSVCFWDSFKNCAMMLTPLSVMNFLIFAPIMVLSSLTLFIKVQRSSQRLQPGKLYIVILLTVLFFLIFAVPLSLVTFLQNFYYEDHNLISTTFMLASINSSVNPVIYLLVGSYRKQRFRGSIKFALQRVFEDKADPKKERGCFSGDTMVIAT